MTEMIATPRELKLNRKEAYPFTEDEKKNLRIHSFCHVHSRNTMTNAKKMW